MADVIVSPWLQNLATGVKNAVTGAGTFSQPKATMSVPANSKPIDLAPAPKIGVQAKAPSQNITPVNNKLAPAQVKKTVAPTNTTASTSKPGLLSNLATQQKNMATLYGTNGAKTAVQVGSQQAKDLQSKGYGLTAGSYKAPAGATGNDTELPPTKYTAGGVKTDKNEFNQYIPDVSSSGSLQNLANNASIGEPIIGENAGKISALSDKGNSAMSSPSYQKYQDTTQSVSDLDREYADEMAKMSSAPMSLEFKQGRQQVLTDQYNAKRLGLVNEANNYLTQNQQTMTGVQSQQTGYQNAGNLGVAGQGLRQSGLATAATLAQPTYQQYGSAQVTRDENGNTTTSPVGGNSSANPLSQVASIAQQVISGKLTPQAAQAMGGSVANWQSILNDAIQKQSPGFNYNVAGGLGAAQGSTAATQSTLSQAMQSSYQQAQNVRTQLDDFIKTAVPNTSDINQINKGLQAIAANTSDPRYAILNNYLASLKNIYANILGGGTATVDAQQRADAFVDNTMSSSGIQAVLNAVEQEAQARMSGVGTSGGMGTSSGSGGAGGSASAGGFNFTQDANGNWVVAK